MQYYGCCYDDCIFYNYNKICYKCDMKYNIVEKTVSEIEQPNKESNGNFSMVSKDKPWFFVCSKFVFNEKIYYISN